MTKVLTIGTFDVPHIGHAYLLRACERLGDTVEVGVNSDRFVRHYKGRTPLFDQDERRMMIQSAGYPAHLNDGPGWDLITRVDPDVLAVGDDWLGRDYLTQIGTTVEQFREAGILLAFVPNRIISTTDILKRARE